MGAKYMPTVKDQKASLRFQKKQNPPPDFKKSSHLPPEKKSTKPKA